MSGGSRRAVLAALGANVGVAVTKLIGFGITGSASLLAESMHSLADSGNQGLLLLGGRRAREQPSPEHPFGRGRERYFWAFVVGLVLFGLGGTLSIVEGIRKVLSGGHEISNARVAVGLLLAAAVIEGASLRTGIRAANAIRPDGLSWWSFVRRTRHPEVAVVLLEDGAALAGLGIALVGIVASRLTGNGTWDGLASVGIGVLLCVVATFLTVEMKSLLLGETVSTERQRHLRAAIAGVPGIDMLLNLRTEHLGPDQVLVCVKVALSEPMDLARVIAVLNEVEAAVMAAVPETLTCYVEPDRYDESRVGIAWT